MFAQIAGDTVVGLPWKMRVPTCSTALEFAVDQATNGPNSWQQQGVHGNKL